jgi:hypothetical protein
MLWFSLGPTTIIEDVVSRNLKQYGTGSLHSAISAAASGVVAALLITSQVEHIITASHVRQKGILSTLRHLYRTQPLSIILPPGMMAMVGREISFSTGLFFLRPLIYERAGLLNLYPSTLLT